MKLPDDWLVSVGALSSAVGFLVLGIAPLDDLLPINRVLFATICSLLTAWVLIHIIRILGGRP